MAEAFGMACHELVSLDFRCGSRLPVSAAPHPRPESGVKRKDPAGKPTFGLPRPVLEVLLPWMAPPPNGGC